MGGYQICPFLNAAAAPTGNFRVLKTRCESTDGRVHGEAVGCAACTSLNGHFVLHNDSGSACCGMLGLPLSKTCATGKHMCEVPPGI